MPILSKEVLRNAELYFVKMDPKKPVLNFNDDGYEWVIQVRTSDKKEAQKWKDDFHVNVKFDQEDPKSGKVWHGGNISRRAYMIADGKDSMFEPPDCKMIQGQNAVDLDARTIGNGSIGDVRIQTRSWSNKKKSGITTDLLAVLVRDLKEYTQIADPDWDLSGGDTVVTPIGGAAAGGGNEDDDSAY